MKLLIIFILASVHSFSQTVYTARPIEDVTVTSFTGTPTNTAGNRYTNVDETSANQTTDYVYSAVNTAATIEFKLGNIGLPFTIIGNGSVNVQMAKSNGATIDNTGNGVTVTIALYQGTTLITSTSFAAGAWATNSLTVNQSNVSSITDASDVRVRITTTASGGTAANRRGVAISYVDLQVTKNNAAGRKARLILSK